MITELKNTITTLQQVIKNLVDDDEIKNLQQTITILNRIEEDLKYL